MAVRSYWALLLTFVLGAPPALAYESTQVTIYTAIEAEQVVWINEAMARAVPEADIRWVRASTGMITDRLLAERDAPRADIVFGVAASSLMSLEQADLLAEYKPVGADQLRSFFLDPYPERRR